MNTLPIPTYECARATGPIRIDAVLDEADWQRAPVAVLNECTNGTPLPPELRSEARMLWDDENLYVAFDVADPDIRCTLSKRDDCLFEEDVVELFVGMRERQGLKLIAEEGGESVKYRVPLRPGGVVLVNVKRKGEYGVFDLEKVKGRKINGELVRLAAEMSRNEAPKSAVSVRGDLARIGKDAFDKTVNDLFFTGSDYTFSRIPMSEAPNGE